MGLFALSFSYLDVIGLTYISNAFNQTYAQSGIVPVVNVQSLSNSLYQFSFFWPDLAAICSLILIVESWMLSFFLRATPLAAVPSIFLLVVYTVASMEVSNAAVNIARLPVWQPIIAQGGLLLILWVNMPVILIIASIIDIAIALLGAAARLG